jgi:DNA modification methylase
MCGDSTSPTDIAKLMAGKKADLVFTDPPYRQEELGGQNDLIGKAVNKKTQQISDMIDFHPETFLLTLPTVFQNKTMNAYIFCNKELIPDYLNWALENKYSFNVLFWKKPNGMPLASSHRPDVEYIMFIRKNATWNNSVAGVNYSKCLEYSRQSGTPHPTMKPVALIENELQISSPLAGLVVDFFGGSGSTLIAAHETNRVAYLMELDPKYCDVICKRWEQLTGVTPIAEATGNPHTFL